MKRSLIIAADWVYAYLNMFRWVIVEIFTSWVFWVFILALIVFVGTGR